MISLPTIKWATKREHRWIIDRPNCAMDKFKAPIKSTHVVTPHYGTWRIITRYYLLILHVEHTGCFSTDALKDSLAYAFIRLVGKMCTWSRRAIIQYNGRHYDHCVYRYSMLSFRNALSYGVCIFALLNMDVLLIMDKCVRIQIHAT